MQSKDFYLNVMNSEENITKFLRKPSLLDTAKETLLYHKCGTEMVNAVRNDVAISIIFEGNVDCYC